VSARPPIPAALAAVAVALAAVVAPLPASAEQWSPLTTVPTRTLAVALDDGTTALMSTGGPAGATVYDQRRAADGSLGPSTAVVSVPGVTACRPVESASALSNVAVGVECQVVTGQEEPPTRLVELVWTGDDGWVWKVVREGELASVDYSPQGQYALFASNSRYGGPHRLTTYHADLGWEALRRPQLGPTGDHLVAAVSDGGDVVAVRGASDEDEPGYYTDGRLRVDTWANAGVRGRWTVRLDRAYPDGGVRPTAVDLGGSGYTATLVQSRSTGRLDGRADRLVVLGGTPTAVRLRAVGRWSRQVLAADAARTVAGVGVAAWQSVEGRTARTRLATWAPGRARPVVRALALPGRTTLTDAVATGRGLDLAVSPGGRGLVARVEHLRGATDATVRADAFTVDGAGAVGPGVQAAWPQPRGVTVDVSAAAASAAVALGLLSGPFYLEPLTAYAVLR
jgi:hypothetical protein